MVFINQNYLEPIYDLYKSELFRTYLVISIRRINIALQRTSKVVDMGSISFQRFENY